MSIAINIGASDAIDTYATLTSEIAAWLDRDDLNARIPGFIRLCESRLNRLLRTPDMETSGQLLVSTEDATLPLDYLQLREAYLEGTPDRPLRTMSPDALASSFNGSTGIPQAIAIIGRTFRLAPPPASQTLVQLVYFAKIPALTQATQSNWLLDQAPDIYLYGSLLQAAAFIDDDAQVAKWKAAYDEAIGELVNAGTAARWGSSPLVPNTTQQVRGARC